jgi:hypothetical protein
VPIARIIQHRNRDQLCGQKAKSLCLLCFSGSDHPKKDPKQTSFGDELVTSFAIGKQQIRGLDLGLSCLLH